MTAKRGRLGLVVLLMALAGCSGSTGLPVTPPPTVSAVSSTPAPAVVTVTVPGPTSFITGPPAQGVVTDPLAATTTVTTASAEVTDLAGPGARLEFTTGGAIGWAMLNGAQPVIIGGGPRMMLLLDVTVGATVGPLLVDPAYWAAKDADDDRLYPSTPEAEATTPQPRLEPGLVATGAEVQGLVTLDAPVDQTLTIQLRDSTGSVVASWLLPHGE